MKVQELEEKYLTFGKDVNEMFKERVLEIGQANVARYLDVNRSYITNLLKERESENPKTKIELLKKLENYNVADMFKKKDKKN